MGRINTVNVVRMSNSILLKKNTDEYFFSSGRNFFLISIENFSRLLKFMVENNIISVKVLEGVVSEYHNRNN